MTSRLKLMLGRLFSREGFRGPVLTLLSGSAVTLVVSYLAQLVLRRLFTPEEFGITEYFVSMLGVLITFASLRYEDAIMLPADDDEAIHVLWLSLLLVTAAAIMLGVAAIWSGPIAAVLRVPAVAPFLWLVPPTLLLMRYGRILEVWSTRQRAFRLVAGVDAANKLTMTVSRLAAGFWTTLGAGGLIGGFIAGHATGALAYTARSIADGDGPLRRSFDPRASAAAARRYLRFPLYAAPATLLNTLVARLPVLLLPVFFADLAILGYFGFAFMALAVPLGLVGGAVANVFFVHAAEARRSGNLAGLSETVHARLVMLGLYPTVALVAAGPDIFTFFFGTTWRPAGEYEQLLGAWFLAAGIASPLTRIFDVLERQRTELIISIGMFSAQALALIIGGRTGSITLTLALLGLVGASARAIHIGAMMRLAGVAPLRALYPYLRYLVFALPGLALMGVALPFQVAAYSTAAAVCGGAVYLALVLWKDRLLAEST